MKIIPALYIQNGKVVSFYKGTDNAEKNRYDKAPKTFARDFYSAGAKRLFVVDLDGDQQTRLNEIREVFLGEIWWAGQVRTLELIESLLEQGANKVVLGWSAKSIFKEAIQRFGADKIMAGLQLQHYDDAPDFCTELAEAGFEEIIVKDLNAEGTLFQPNFDLMEKCAIFSEKKVYASGGISEINHINLLQRAHVEGVIIARAFYENRLGLSDLVQSYEGDL